MKQGKEAPIPFAELVEVTQATFAIEEAIRTQRMACIDGETAYQHQDLKEQPEDLTIIKVQASSTRGPLIPREKQ